MKHDLYVVLQIAGCMPTYYMSLRSGEKEPKRAQEQEPGQQKKTNLPG
jgi:hypothetical protein